MDEHFAERIALALEGILAELEEARLERKEQVPVTESEDYGDRLLGAAMNHYYVR